MALTITSKVENEIAILELEGSLTLGPALHQLRTLVGQTLNRGHLRGLILHVSGVTGVDSAGLGELTLTYSSSSRQGCRLVVAGPDQNLLTMLKVTHLDGVLLTTPDLQTALASFKS